MKRLLTVEDTRNNYKNLNDKYIKLGDDKLWKKYIKR